jgi:hypothetical protein
LYLGGERQEHEAADTAGEMQVLRHSVLAGLKRSAAEIEAEKKPYQHQGRENRDKTDLCL